MATIEVPTARSTISLDAAHPAQVSRVLFHASPEATAGSPEYSVTIRLDGTAAGASVIVTASAPPVTPTPSAGSSATAPVSPAAGQTWQGDLSAAGFEILPIDCGIGPCERVFWVLAVLTPPATGPVTARWEVGGEVSWNQSAQPQGATADVTIDPPEQLSAPASALTTSTDPETIDFGPDRPAAARVVEVTADASVLADRASPATALTIDVRRAFTFDPSDPEAIGAALVAQVIPLGEPSAGANSAPGPGPTALPAEADPFAGCPAGAPCTRRFLVALSLADPGSRSPTAAGHRPFTWQLTLRRVDLLRAWSSPGEMRTRVIRRFDIASGTPPATARLEGDITAVTGAPASTTRLQLATATTSSDPVAAFPPVPAVMTLTAPLPTSWADPHGTAMEVDKVLPGARLQSDRGWVDGGSVTLLGYPMATPAGVCHVGTACPELRLTIRTGTTTQASPPPQVAYHWSLEVRVYSYTDVPITVVATKLTP
jgi:hypothetical protein